MITAHTSTKSAVEALKAGAFDYIAKPFDIDELKIIVRKAVERKELEDENLHLRTALEERFTFANIIGTQRADAGDLLHRRSASPRRMSTVLISGESGTGKELIARAIHYNSGRRGKFVSINCGALPETLLESELFGHERGAFTGAIREKRGLFHEADRGTIFLDEIGETSTAMQIKLLRVLQDRVVRKVGSNVEIHGRRARHRRHEPRPRRVDPRRARSARISSTASTSSRSRCRRCGSAREDIPLLVEHFIEQVLHERWACRRSGSPSDAMRAIEKYHWPGNVRELENVVERMIALEAVRRPHHEVAPRARPPRRTRSRTSTFDLPAEGISLRGPSRRRSAKIFMLKALERTRRRADAGRGAAADVVPLVPLLREKIRPHPARARDGGRGGGGE